MVMISDDPMFTEETASGWTVSSPPKKFTFTGTGINHTAVIKDLQPNTLYYIAVFLNPTPEYDIAGWKAYNTFAVTKKRRVSVGIQHIFVIDDSDDFGAGELLFKFQLGPEHGNFNEPGNTWDHEENPSPSGYLSLASGEGFWPWVGMSGLDVEDSAKIAVSCTDIDSWKSGLYNTPDTYKGTGCNDVAEWNSGFWIVDISGGTEMSQGSTLAERETFSFDLIETVHESAHSCLEYQIWGSVSVSYE